MLDGAQQLPYGAWHFSITLSLANKFTLCLPKTLQKLSPDRPAAVATA